MASYNIFLRCCDTMHAIYPYLTLQYILSVGANIYIVCLLLVLSRHCTIDIRYVTLIYVTQCVHISPEVSLTSTHCIVLLCIKNQHYIIEFDERVIVKANVYM